MIAFFFKSTKFSLMMKFCSVHMSTENKHLFLGNKIVMVAVLGIISEYDYDDKILYYMTGE